MALERYLDKPEAEGLKRARAERPEGFALVGPWLELPFPASGTPRDIQHGLGAVPNGYEVIFQIGGSVRASSVTSWTTELAFLQADAANTRAIVRFVRTGKDPINA